MIRQILILCLLVVTGACWAAPHWETVTEYHFGNNDNDSYRLEVPHGWLVVTRISTGTAMAFVQDEQHGWKL